MFGEANNSHVAVAKRTNCFGGFKLYETLFDLETQ